MGAATGFGVGAGGGLDLGGDAGGGGGGEEVEGEGEVLVDDARCSFANRFMRIWGDISQLYGHER